MTARKAILAAALCALSIPAASKAEVAFAAVAVPGALPGAGTINFNTQQGQTNSFNVGANTNIGLTTSTNSTDVYEAKAGGKLSLGQGWSFAGDYAGAAGVEGGWGYTPDLGGGGGFGVSYTGAVQVNFGGGTSAIMQSIGNSASAEANTEGGFGSGGTGAKAAVGVVAGTFQTSNSTDASTGAANSTAEAVVSGLGNKSNVYLGSDSNVMTDIALRSGAAPVVGTSNTASASSNALISTTANAAASSSVFQSAFINVLTGSDLIYGGSDSGS